jgi:glucokinase
MGIPSTLVEPGFTIGVDVGGTKVAAGLVDPAGKIKYSTRVAMVANKGAAAGLAAVTQAIDIVRAKSATSGGADGELRGIGICSPGPLDPHTGIVINPPNLVCWRNFPLADEVSKIYGVPVKVDNDANAGALAEALWGAGRGYCNVFLTTLGTGVGTGIVQDGHIYHGRTGAAGEGGHMSIDYRGPLCGCGKPGCIEVFASGPAIAKRAQAKLADGTHDSSALLRLANGNPNAVTAEMVGQAYATGDAVAAETLRDTVNLLSIWLSNIIDLLEPDVLIMGGGVAAMMAPFFDDIRKRLPALCVNSRGNEIPLVPAYYGADAGIAGGGALVAEPQTLRT